MRKASERQRASSTRSPAVDPDHEVCRDDGGARNGQPPVQAAPSRASGWAVAEAGAASPERSEAERGSAQRRGSAARTGKPRKGGQRSGGARGA